MKHYKVDVCKIVYSLTDEFSSYNEARDKAVAVRDALRAESSSKNVEYFFEVEELEDTTE